VPPGGDEFVSFGSYQCPTNHRHLGDIFGILSPAAPADVEELENKSKGLAGQRAINNSPIYMEAPLQYQHPVEEEEEEAEHPLASGGWAPFVVRQQQQQAAGTTAAQGMRLADHSIVAQARPPAPAPSFPLDAPKKAAGTPRKGIALVARRT
jgi:hypothetical protein